MNDPIVDEVRRIRDAHAARFNYNLRDIFLDIKQREKARGFHFVDGVALQSTADTNCQPTEMPKLIFSDSKEIDTDRVDS